METIGKGCLVIDDGDNTFYAVQPNDIKQFYELDADGNSITGDNTKWKKKPMTLNYYITPFDVDIKVSWQNDPLHATKGYFLVSNNKEGTDISPVAPVKFNDKTLWQPINEAIKYTKQQVCEAIAYWKSVLSQLNEDDSKDFSNLKKEIILQNFSEKEK